MRFVAVIAALVSVGSSVSAQPRDSQADKATMVPFAGTWRLAATRQRMTDGTIRPDPDLGSRPTGYMMFDVAAEKMCVVINNGDRSLWADPSTPTDREARDIWNQMVTYCAAWSVDSKRSELVYRIEIDLLPNRPGTERRRRFSMEGDRLILRPNPLPAGVVDWEVEWRRMSASPQR